MVEARIGIAAGMIKEANHVPTELLDTVSHVTVGSYTLHPREGNPEPTTYYDEEKAFMLNAIGLKNVGLKAFIENELSTLCSLFANRLAHLRVSLAPTKAGELAEMCELLNYYKVDELIDELEINGACPNHRSGDTLHPVLARDPIAVEALLMEASNYRGAKAFKIAPQTDHETLGRIVELCVASDITTLVSGNTLLHTSEVYGKQRLSVPMGGLSGRLLFGYTIRQLELLRSIIDNSGSKLRLIGCGGVLDEEGAEHLIDHVGADELQVATLYWNHGPKAVSELIQATAYRLMAA